MWIWADAPVVAGSKAEGNVRVTPPTEKLYLPCYTLRVPTNETEDITDLEALGRQAGVTGHHVFPSVRVAALYKRIWKAQASFGAAVKSIEANTVGEANGATYEGDPSGGSELCPSGPYYNWARHYTAGYPKGANLNNLPANERIQNFSTGSGVKVAVIDTGFQNVGETYTPGTVIKGVETEYNAVTGAADVTGTAPGYHGRRVASMIFAPHNDYAGTMGTAENASPYLVHTDVSAEANKRAIEQCRRWGVKVINISWSTTVVQTAFRDALRLATDYDGAIVVSAAGNNGDRLEYPPAHDKVIGVGGHDEYGNKSFFSSATGNYSNSLNVDIWAPANYIAVAANTAAERYKINWVEGTSFASPLVAGIVACMVQRGYVSDYTSALNRLQNKGHLYNNLNNSKSLDGIRAIKAY
jgi:subtilisin family serine protease